MAHGGMHKKKKSGGMASFDINVTPMIDMFSVLIAFLLMTAVFNATGMHRIDIAFLSSKAPPTQKEIEKNVHKTANLTLLDNNKVRLEIATTVNSTPISKEEYPISPDGLDRLQGVLYDMRKQDPVIDEITLFADHDVTYSNLVKVLDAVRILKSSRPPIPWPEGYKLISQVEKEWLFPKVRLGNGGL